MNILIGNEGNKIEVVADPNVLAGYRFVVERKLSHKKLSNEYFIIIYLGNVKILAVRFIYMKFWRYASNIEMFGVPEFEWYKIENNRVRFSRDFGNIYLCLSLDHVSEFKEKIRELKRIFNRDLRISSRFISTGISGYIEKL